MMAQLKPQTQNIELGYLANGNIAFMSDRPFPDRVKRVEYYKAQRLFTVVYNSSDDDGELLEYEISEDAAHKVEQSREVLIYVDDMGYGEPEAYYTSLIQVGV